MPDHGIPTIGRWHVSWVILAVIWMGVAISTRTAIDFMELAGLWRYTALAAAIPVFWYSAKRILEWGRAGTK